MPLRRVLAVLPVDEMANLAETLINLQSLKEKVTKNSETVGGPVDVAIITRNEGLIWVKRKHFFDIGLNSRLCLAPAGQIGLSRSSNMTPTAFKEPAVDRGASQQGRRDEVRERIVRESAERYQRSIDEVNKTKDADIEKALRS